MRKKIYISLLASSVIGAPAWAHHGWSSYEAEKPVKVETSLLEVEYRNPHAHVVVDRDGQQWDVILAPIRRLESRGLSEDDLTVGKTVIIEGYPRRDGSREIRAERITVDGKTIELR